MVVPASADAVREVNSNTVTGSTLSGSPVVAGSRASIEVSVGSEPGDKQVAEAVADLRRKLAEVRATVDDEDDDTREALVLASDRLSTLEKQLSEPEKARDANRISKLMKGIADSVAGLAGLTTSVDALWNAVQQAVR